MADVTARLLWYRLSESSEYFQLLWDGILFVADAGGTALNYVFLFWLLFGILTIVIVSVIHHNEPDRRTAKFNHYQYIPEEYTCKECKGSLNREYSRMAASQSSTGSVPLQSQHIQWQNSILEWLNNRDSQWKASFMESLLTVMTEESRKLGVS